MVCFNPVVRAGFSAARPMTRKDRVAIGFQSRCPGWVFRGDGLRSAAIRAGASVSIPLSGLGFPRRRAGDGGPAGHGRFNPVVRAGFSAARPFAKTARSTGFADSVSIPLSGLGFPRRPLRP